MNLPYLNSFIKPNQTDMLQLYLILTLIYNGEIGPG